MLFSTSIYCFLLPLLWKLPFTILSNLMISFCVHTERLNAKNTIDVKSHMAFITLENSPLLKRNGCPPEYIFRDILPDTLDMFSSTMILPAICSLYFFFFPCSVVFLSLFNISLWLHFSIFLLSSHLFPSFHSHFFFCCSLVLCWDSSQSLFGFMYMQYGKLNLTKACLLFIIAPFQHIPSGGRVREWSFLAC